MDVDEDDVAALRSALRHAVGTICERERGARGLALEPDALATLCFVVEQYAKRLAGDIPAFAKHARRGQATADDVLLVARDNPEILRKLEDFVAFHDLRGKPAKPAGAKRRKKGPDKTDHDDDVELLPDG